MIYQLDKEQTRTERRKLLEDIVYLILCDVLKELHADGETAMSPVELFLSARDFARTVLSLPDAEEGLQDEMDDLEEEASGQNDAMIIMMIAACILLAVGKNRLGFESKKAIMPIITRWMDHPLFYRILDAGCKKEAERLAAGKRNNLLAYELQEIDRNGEGDEAVRQLMRYVIAMSDKVDPETVKGNIVIFGRYNMDHNNAFQEEMNALYEKFGIRSSTISQHNEYVGTKYVDTEIGNIAQGGTGVVKSSNKVN